jgi:SAM-dependent methyltransferase
MSDWAKKLFIERADLFLKLLDARWAQTDELVNGMVKVLRTQGIASGNLLDLCCGNGRISVYVAKQGFKAVGVDLSQVFVEDARRKAREHHVADSVRFLVGDVRTLKEVVGPISSPFDVVVTAWTSIGFSSREDDLNVFRQARELAREGAVLFVAQTMHSEYLSVKFTPTSFADVNGLVLLESREYDSTTSQMRMVWSFFSKEGKDLKFIDDVEVEVHVYSVSELSSLLREAGWKPIASYGSLATLQPLTPLTHLNLVAKAR